MFSKTALQAAAVVSMISLFNAGIIPRVGAASACAWFHFDFKGYRRCGVRIKPKAAEATVCSLTWAWRLPVRS